MKRSQKLLSLILMFCIFTTVLTGYTSAETLSEAPQAVDETFELPDIVDSLEAKENGYVSRVKTQEKDLYTFVFSNGNGTNTMRVYSHPVKYVAEDGTVRDISLDIEEKRGGGFVSADHEIVTTFESKLTDGISLAYNDIEIELVPNLGLGTVPSARSDGKSVTYDTSNTTSYVYGLTYAGFKEDIVVKEYTGQTEYSFTLFTNGLALYEEYGSYYLADAIGNVKANIGDIIVFTADERNNTMGSMTYETIRANEEYLLTIHLDAEYLADEATVYPIRIDPTIEINYSASGSGAIEDVTINQNVTFSGTSGSLYVGRHPAGSLSRILMRFPNLSLSGIEYTDITAASVEIRDLICQGDENITIECFVYMGPTWSESGSTSWTSVGTDYLGPFIDSRVISYGYGDSGGQRYSFNVLSVARAWAFGMMSPLKGLVFKADDDFENQTGDAANKWYKTFAAYNRASNQPSLSISYNGDDIEPGNPGGDSGSNPGGDSGGGSEEPPEETVTGTEYYIVFQSDGKMLTADSSYNLSTTAYSANNSYQKWVYTEVSTGVYVIRMKNNTNKCLTAVPGTSTITIANVSAGNTNQYWKMTILSGGNALQSQSTNKRLYLSGGSFTLNSSSYSSLAFIKVSNFVPCTSMTLDDIYVSIGKSKYVYPTCYPSNATLTSGWAVAYTASSDNAFTVNNNCITAGNNFGSGTLTVTNKITGASCTADVYVIRLPNPDAQNKDKWCWAAASKMVGEHNGGSGALDTGFAVLTYTDGLHSYDREDFYGQNLSMQYIVDAGQRQILLEIYGNDISHNGTNENKERALELAASTEVITETLGNEIGGLNNYEITDMDDDLSDNLWVVGSVFTEDGDGHSIVIRSYDSSDQKYYYWDPWTNKTGTFTKSELDNDTIRMAWSSTYRALTYVQRCIREG